MKTKTILILPVFATVIICLLFAHDANASLTGHFVVNVKLQNVNAATGPLKMNATLLSDHTLVPVVWQTVFISSPINNQIVKFNHLQTLMPVGQFFVCATEPANHFKNKCTLFPLTKNDEWVKFSVP